MIDGRVHRGGLVHHSDRGSQYVSIKYTEAARLRPASSLLSAVGRRFPIDNALAGKPSTGLLYKAEVIHRAAGHGRRLSRAVRVRHSRNGSTGFKQTDGLLEPIGNIPGRAESRANAYLRHAGTIGHGSIT